MRADLTCKKTQNIHPYEKLKPILFLLKNQNRTGNAPTSTSSLNLKLTLLLRP